MPVFLFNHPNMILTLTLNPAIDKSTMVDKMIPGKKLRCRNIIREPGDGGINVSKALKELGGHSRALFPAGGANGGLLIDMLKGLGITHTAIDIASETREDFTVLEEGSLNQYRFVMPGAPLNETEIQRCLDAIVLRHPIPSIVVTSGSLPPGVPDDFLARLAEMLKCKGVKLIVDTSGHPLQLAARAGVYLLKPNLSELCSLSDTEMLAEDEIVDAAQAAIAKGYCEVMVISMADKGALMVTREASISIPAPTVNVLSTVGAGDSMVAGMVWMLEQKKTFIEIACFGVACGTAATMNAGTQLFRKEDAFRLYQQLSSEIITSPKSRSK